MPWEASAALLIVKAARLREQQDEEKIEAATWAQYESCQEADRTTPVTVINTIVGVTFSQPSLNSTGERSHQSVGYGTRAGEVKDGP